MSDRDWDAELAKIDRQLAGTSDARLASQAAARPVASGAVPGRSTSSRSSETPSHGPRWRGWARVLVVAAAAGALWLWPWSMRCGGPLLGCLGAIAGLLLLGIWSAVGTWRYRLAGAHLLALMAVLWAALLGARELLPRVGYAIPTSDRGTTWMCESVTPPAAAPVGGTPGVTL